MCSGIKQMEKNKINLRQTLRKIVKFLGRFFAAGIILVVAAHFVPELRESMPQLFHFIEKILFGFVNWCYGIINKILL